MSPFGAVLKDLRAQLGLSQVALAGELATTQRHISFLETGRSQPTSAFLTRICRELGLSIAQRANLFDASGLNNPYTRRAMDSAEITATLDMIEARILRHWPFPALVLDPCWNIVRANAAFSGMFGAFLPDGNDMPNFLDIILSPAFRDLVENWSEVAPVFYFRLQAAAAKDPSVAELFSRLRARGAFDGLDQLFVSDHPVPVYVPVRLALPDGSRIEVTSLLGRLAAAQDALVEGFEIELILPTNEQSEARLRAALGNTATAE